MTLEQNHSLDIFLVEVEALFLDDLVKELVDEDDGFLAEELLEVHFKGLEVLLVGEEGQVGGGLRGGVGGVVGVDL